MEWLLSRMSKVGFCFFEDKIVLTNEMRHFSRIFIVVIFVIKFFSKKFVLNHKLNKHAIYFHQLLFLQAPNLRNL